MQLDKIEGNTVSVKGNIKTAGDYQELKGYIQKIVDGGSGSVTLNILDSTTVTSSVVGYLFKITNLNNVTVNVNVKDQRLYKIMDDLKLIDIFNVKKV